MESGRESFTCDQFHIPFVRSIRVTSTLKGVNLLLIPSPNPSISLVQNEEWLFFLKIISITTKGYKNSYIYFMNPLTTINKTYQGKLESI